MIADIDSETVLIKVRCILQPKSKSLKIESPAMIERLEESRRQISEGKGVKIPLNDLWKYFFSPSAREDIAWWKRSNHSAQNKPTT
ncbi:hypothetical protein [Mucilaginibacter ginkgonis]|uniref:hypothetical protein n=1 Tax=Mucilaginibacter ginkgonis TaxID=2682091 RepID=UPI0021CF84FA|nr:hypothetical protein [Mucilaginibacter ginkgonis]